MDRTYPCSRENLEEYRRVLECVHSGVYVVDTNREIVIWNPSAEKITGYEGAAVEGCKCGETLLAHVDRDGHPLCGWRCPLTATLADGKPRDASVYLRHKCGHRVAVEVHIERLCDWAGHVLGAVESFERRDPRECSAVAAEPQAALDPITGMMDTERSWAKLGVLLAEANVFQLPLTGMLLRLERLPEQDTAEYRSAMRAAAQTLGDAFPEAIVARWDRTRILAVTAQQGIEPANYAHHAEHLVATCRIEVAGKTVCLSSRAKALKSQAGEGSAGFMARLERAMIEEGETVCGITGEFEAV